ncbi:MAG: hypothetical protein KDC92_01345 [Bacteroidetes bacterium]|nr:hypothetical protein [Bacteroidota bacterium]
MRILIILSIIVLAVGCEPTTKTQPKPTQEPAETISTHFENHVSATGFDSLLAQELKADKYGMGQYVMAFLKAGPNRNRTAEEAAELQKQHMANIGRLAKEGKLVLAGPFIDNGELRGIYIFDVTTIEEAAELTATDPAIQAGSLVMELHPWYGSAALRKVNQIHSQIAEIEI